MPKTPENTGGARAPLWHRVWHRLPGQIWKNTGHIVDIPEAPAPIIGTNIAIGRSCDSSWSDDCNLMDLANDDDFGTSWVSSPEVAQPWWKVDLDETAPVSMVVITEGPGTSLDGYEVEALCDGEWTRVASGGTHHGRVHICRFTPVEAESLRVHFTSYSGLLSIAEVGIYEN